MKKTNSYLITVRVSQDQMVDVMPHIAGMIEDFNPVQEDVTPTSRKISYTRWCSNSKVRITYTPHTSAFRSGKESRDVVAALGKNWVGTYGDLLQYVSMQHPDLSTDKCRQIRADIKHSGCLEKME